MFDGDANNDLALLQRMQGNLSAESLSALAAHVLANGLPNIPLSSDEEYDDEEFSAREYFPTTTGQFQRSPSGHTTFSWGTSDKDLCKSPVPISLAALGHFERDNSRSSYSALPRGHTTYSWPRQAKATPPVPAAISRASSFEKTTPNDSAVATMQRLRALDAATQVFWHLSSNYCIIYYMTFKSNYSNFCLLRALAMSFCCVFHDQCAVESTIAASAGVLELEATAPCNAVETMVIHK